MIPFTLVMAYYDNPNMLREQLSHIEKLSSDVRKHLLVTIVDDGSPNHSAAEVLSSKDAGRVKLFRMDVDVRWNQDACRNVGMAHLHTEWALLTDMDHLIPDDTWRGVMRGALDPTRAYTFARVSAPAMTPHKYHPNTWAMTKTLYKKLGGYDERFAGLYGTDGDFRDRLAKIAQIEQLKLPIIRVPRELVADASTTSYGRKEQIDREGIPRVKAERARLRDQRPLQLSFPYHRVPL